MTSPQRSSYFYIAFQKNSQIGAIMTPHDARKMLDAGADMIQIYSSLIDEGPAIVKKMIKATQ